MVVGPACVQSERKGVARRKRVCVSAGTQYVNCCARLPRESVTYVRTLYSPARRCVRSISARARERENRSCIWLSQCIMLQGHVPYFRNGNVYLYSYTSSLIILFSRIRYSDWNWPRDLDFLRLLDPDTVYYRI